MPAADSVSNVPYVPRRKKRRKGKPTINQQMKRFRDDGMGKNSPNNVHGAGAGDYYLPRAKRT